MQIDDLLELTQILGQGEICQYWQRCAEVLLTSEDVEAVSIQVFPSHETTTESRVRVGDFCDNRLRRIDRWEEALHSAPVPASRLDESTEHEEFQPIEVGKVELAIGRPPRNCQSSTSVCCSKDCFKAA